MITIYKYELEVANEQNINVTEGFEILSVQFQNGKLCLWVRLDTNNFDVRRQISIRGTGQNCEGLGAFIGTVQTCDGGLVLHVFESN